MGNTRVKVLFDSNAGQLGRLLQEWLGAASGKINIVKINIDSNQYGHCLSILYELGAGPHYQGWIWFNRRHDNLEDEVNRSLEQLSTTRPLLAKGSNDYGHCLCIISEA